MSTRSTIDYVHPEYVECATCKAVTPRGIGFAVETGCFETDRVYVSIRAGATHNEIEIPIALWPRIRAAVDRAVEECAARAAQDEEP